MARLDRRTLLAIVFNVILAALIVLVPAVRGRSRIEVYVEPSSVPLNTNFTLRVDIRGSPTKVVVSILEGIVGKEVYREEFPGSPPPITLVAEEGKYSIGAHLVRVEAEIGGKVYKAETMFSVIHGGNLSVIADISPDSLDQSGGNATISVYVENELGKPVEGALVWLIEESGMLSFSENPAVTDQSGRAIITVNAQPGNYTAKISLIIAKRGHPLAKEKLSLRVCS